MQVRGQITFVSNASERFKQALSEHKARTGEGQAEVAKQAGLGQSAISNAISRGTLPKDYAAMSEYMGFRPRWVRDGTGPKFLKPVALPLSFDEATVEYTEPSRLDWREIPMFLAKGDLPRTFRAQLPDDAMGKTLPKGMWIVFDRASEAPNRRRVLVLVDGRELYFRRVKEVEGGWIAKPDDEDFLQFDSRERTVEIIATMRHAEVPDDQA